MGPREGTNFLNKTSKVQTTRKKIRTGIIGELAYVEKPFFSPQRTQMGGQLTH